MHILDDVHLYYICTRNLSKIELILMRLAGLESVFVLLGIKSNKPVKILVVSFIGNSQTKDDYLGSLRVQLRTCKPTL